MEHYWNTFDGYMTFPDYYAWVAGELAKLGRPVRAVEVGVFTGQSAACLGVELINRKVEAKLDLVDTFTEGGSVADVLKRLLPVLPVIGKAITSLSWEAAKQYEDVYEHALRTFTPP